MTETTGTLATIEDVRDMYFPGTPLGLRHLFGPGTRRDKVVAHVMARAGSNRIADKNIRELHGLPLIAYSIIMAREMGADMVLLNTDSEHYRRVGERFGAQCPFLRPAPLGGDDVSPGLASYYAMRRLLESGYPVGLWIDMYPTSPFRSLRTLGRFMEILRKAGTCVSVGMMPAPARRAYLPEKGGAPIRLDYDESLFFYKPVGTFLGQNLDAERRYWRHYEAVVDPIELIDIDTERDWALAETILENRLFDFGVTLP